MVIDFLQSYFFDPARVPLALLALALTALAGLATGPLAGNANPFFWLVIDKIFGAVGGRLDRRERASRDLMTRGLILTILALAFISAAALATGLLADRYPVRGGMQIVLLSVVLSGGAAWKALTTLHKALQNRKMQQGAYLNIVRSGRIDLSRADDYTITRTSMGLITRIFDKGCVAPVFWFLVGGLPAAYIYAGVAALAWRFGKDGFTKGFGQAALMLEYLLGIVPHIIVGLLMALAGLFTPTGGMARAFKGLLRRSRRAPYMQGGLPVTAMAFSLKVSLGGPVQDIDGSALKRSWVGPDGATAQLEAGHLRRALYIVMMAWLLLVAGLAGLMVLV